MNNVAGQGKSDMWMGVADDVSSPMGPQAVVDVFARERGNAEQVTMAKQ